MNKLYLLAILLLCSQFSLFSSNKLPNNSAGEDSISVNKFFIRETVADGPDVDASDDDVINPWFRYESGPKSSMAILITNPNCAWPALARGLNTIGVPFTITDKYKSALEHNVVMIYPELNTNSADASVFFNLRDFVRNGGVLIGTNVEGLGLEDVFGYDNAGYAGEVNAVQLLKTTFPLETFESKKDQNIDIKNIKLYMKAVKYTNPMNFPIAAFDNGNAAILENSFGKGKAFAIGFDIGSILSCAYNGKNSEATISSVNQYSPNLDVFLRLIREFYREGGGITFGTCPFGMHLAVVLTHNIDQNKSVINSFEYAKFEKQANVNSTFFVNTNYIKSNFEELMFTDGNINILKQINNMNFEIASNAVTKPKLFRNFPLGNNEETADNYFPEIYENNQVGLGSVTGETRVSKQLLENALKCNVASFRPSYLTFPNTLPQALASANYRYSSSITANDVFTHYPFQLTRNRNDSMEVPVFEFPVTVEIQPGKLTEQLQQTINLAKQISKEDGIMVISIPPTDLDKIFDFEQKFINAMKDKAVFKSLGEFGSWWDARNEVRIEVIGNKIILDSPQLIEGLTLLMPDGSYKVVPFFKNHLEIDLNYPVAKQN